MTNWVEMVVFVVLFVGVSVMGFLAARWQKSGNSLDHLDEWGLGGRKFGSWITWFLVGGDLYTAYTFVAVPALLFGAGATGFFALPYTVILYPLVFLPVLRLWSVSRVHGYVTPADFVRGRYGSPVLALIVAITGLVATMPYIALQLVGLEAVLRTMGLNAGGFLGHLPLLVAFVILAVYTYQSGLRAPALIAFVKDILIYLVIIVAVFYLPAKLGGWETIFGAAEKKMATPNPATGQPTGSILLTANNQLQYVTLALGSALALFLYPHSLTGVLASRGRNVIKRNMVALPAYSFLLGLLALLGYVAIAAGVKPITNNATGRPGHQHDHPGAVRHPVQLVLRGHRVRRHRDRRAGARRDHVDRRGQPVDPQHLQGVPQARRHPRAGGPAGQARVAGREVRRRAVRAGDRPAVLHRPAAHRRRDHPADAARGGHRALHALAAPVGADRGLGGRHGLRALPALAHPRTRPPGRRTSAARRSRSTSSRCSAGTRSPGSPVQIYVGFVALVLNLVVAVLVTLALRAGHVGEGEDATHPADYHADEGSERLRPVAAVVAGTAD